MAKHSKGAKAQGSQAAEGSTVSLHDLAVAAMRAANDATHAQKGAKVAKEGAATVALRMFQTGATEAALREAFTAVEAEARSGLIEGVKLEQAARKGKDGGVAYLIPGSFMNAKSVVTKAAHYSLPRNVTSFNELRDLVKVASDREKLANADEEGKARAAILAALEQLRDTVKDDVKDAKLTVSQLVTIAGWIEGATKLIGETLEASRTVAVTVSADAAQAAESLAEAA